jgi:hypothetical protein
MQTSQKSDERSREEKRRSAFLKQRLTPRARVLFRGLITRIGRDQVDITVEGHVLRVAELTAACEALRLDLSKGAQPTPALINSVTRLESTAARAERALFKIAPDKAERAPTLEEYLGDDE